MEPARAYRDVIAKVTRGLDNRATRNAARIEQLESRVAELDAALRQAGDRHVLTRIGAELAWEDALDVLWNQPWITMRPFPRPSPWAKASELAAHTLAMRERAAELRAAVTQRGLRPPGR